MKNILTFLLFSCTSLWSCPDLFAEQFYISETARGTGDGTSADNTRSVEWFNTRHSWRTDEGTDGRIGPLDVVYFIGPIQTIPVVQKSGKEKLPITLKWTGADAHPQVNVGEHTNIVVIE